MPLSPEQIEQRVQTTCSAFMQNPGIKTSPDSLIAQLLMDLEEHERLAILTAVLPWLKTQQNYKTLLANRCSHYEAKFIHNDIVQTELNILERYQKQNFTPNGSTSVSKAGTDTGPLEFLPLSVSETKKQIKILSDIIDASPTPASSRKRHF